MICEASAPIERCSAPYFCCSATCGNRPGSDRELGKAGGREATADSGTESLNPF